MTSHRPPAPARARVLGVLLALGLVVGVTGCGLGDSNDDPTAKAPTSTVKAPDRLVTATATGKAEGIPDNLSASVGISNGGTSAAQVMTDNSTLTQRLIDELKKAGVADEDVATESVNLTPNYDKRGKIIGYLANNMLRVRFRDLKTAGAKLDTLVRAGGDSARIQGIALGFNDDDALLSSARVDAVKRARAQAAEMAKASGAKLGKVRTITDVLVDTYPLATRSADSAAYGAEAASVPIAAGSQELTVQVRVIFELA